jgi:hypothetical protein
VPAASRHRRTGMRQHERARGYCSRLVCALLGGQCIARDSLWSVGGVLPTPIRVSVRPTAGGAGDGDSIDDEVGGKEFW